jgi:nicotinamide riboside kinase
MRVRSGRTLGVSESDVLDCAVNARNRLRETGHRLIIADTDLVVIKIWWAVRWRIQCVGRHRAARDLSAPNQRLYLLPRPDFPWVGDPLRRKPTTARCCTSVIALLDELGVSYRELTGSKQGDSP